MIYKLDFKSVIYKLLVVSIIFSIVFCFFSEQYSLLTFTISFLLIIGVEMIIFFSRNFLVRIIIKKDNNLIVFHLKKHLVNDYYIDIPINELLFSYKEETGARGVKSKELRFYNKERKKIICIGKGFDGWEEKTILKIIENLREIEIKEIK